MIFNKGEVNSVCVIHNVLMEFQSLSGLSPNPDKSDNHLSGIPDGIREQIVQIRLEDVHCKTLVDQVTARIQH
jgi:hypothetical protein